jgi:hypothetical protein
LASKAELGRQLVAIREREASKLSKLIGVLDADQLAGVASKLRAERTTLEQKLREFESELASSDAVLEGNLTSLADQPKNAVKDAIRRALLWIALTPQGVVAMTAWGTSTAAYFIEPDPKGYKTRETRRTIGPPQPVATLESIRWFVDGEEFVRGLREFQPSRTRSLEDHEVLHAMWRKCA